MKGGEGGRRNMNKNFINRLFGDGSFVRSVKTRWTNGMNKLTGKTNNTGKSIPVNDNVNFKSSIDSGLGSDFSSVKEQLSPQNSIKSTSSSSVLHSSIRTKAVQRTKKKISFFEKPSIFEQPSIFDQSSIFEQPSIFEKTRKSEK